MFFLYLVMSTCFSCRGQALGVAEVAYTNTQQSAAQNRVFQNLYVRTYIQP
jgi:hypothetical protein